MIFFFFIFREWVKTFFYAHFLLLLLLFVANVTSELLRDVTTLSNILKHFFLESPMWEEKILPIATFSSALFTINKLRNTNELVAFYSLGHSPKKLSFLFCFFSLFVCAFTFLCTSYLVPLGKRERKNWFKTDYFRVQKNKGIKSSALESGQIWYKNSDYYAAFSAFDKEKKEIKNFSLYYYDSDSIPQKYIFAISVVHLENNKWTFLNGYVQKNLQKNIFPKTDSFSSQVFTINESLDDFLSLDADLVELNIISLSSYIKKMKSLNVNTKEYEVIFWDKISSGLNPLVFGMIPLSTLYSPQRRNISLAKNIFFIFVFILTYWFFYYSVMALGSYGKIPSFLGAWGIVGTCFITLFISIFFKKDTLNS